MRTIIATLFVLAGVTQAWADFNGSWGGELNYKNNQGDDLPLECDVTLTQTGDTLSILDAGICFYTPEEDTILQIQGNELYYEGELMGTMTDNVITLNQNNSESQWSFSLTVNADGTLTVDEQMTVIAQDPADTYQDSLMGILPVK